MVIVGSAHFNILLSFLRIFSRNVSGDLIVSMGGYLGDSVLVYYSIFVLC